MTKTPAAPVPRRRRRTAARLALAGVSALALLGAACSSDGGAAGAPSPAAEASPQARAGRRDDGRADADLGRRAARDGRRPVRHPALGAHATRLDGHGVGAGAEGAPGGVGTGRVAAGLAARDRRGDPARPGRERRGAHVVDAALRADPAARARVRRIDALRRRERPGVDATRTRTGPRRASGSWPRTCRTRRARTSAARTPTRSSRSSSGRTSRSTSRSARRRTSRRRTATPNPQRAAILRIPPGGGAPEAFARGVRNGTGLAVAPDGRVWTAVNNRDNIQYPYHQPYGGDGDAFGQVIPQYVNDHPPEELAALTPGRDLGWPFCNPEPDTQPGVAGTPLEQADLGFTRDVETNADGSKLDCSTLAADRADLRRALRAAGPDVRDAARAVRRRRGGRGARLVEPDRAAGPGGVVLPVRERPDGRPADRRRGVPGGRRLALGPPGRGGARPGRRALRQRRPGRCDLPGGGAGIGLAPRACVSVLGHGNARTSASARPAGQRDRRGEPFEQLGGVLLAAGEVGLEVGEGAGSADARGRELVGAEGHRAGEREHRDPRGGRPARRRRPAPCRSGSARRAVPRR